MTASLEDSSAKRDHEPAEAHARAQNTVERFARTLEPGTNRRSFLVRAVTFTAVFAAAPIKFILYPEAARAHAGPMGCTSGLCHDSGYTTFCCTLSGGTNNCPSGTQVAGWWYANVGPGYCSQGNLRYYVDCYKSSCSCTCANGSCGNRRQCCNTGYTANCSGPNSGKVFCRIVRCVNPCNIAWPGGITCSCSGDPDQNTCCHSSGAANCNFAAPSCSACGGTP